MIHWIVRQALRNIIALVVRSRLPPRCVGLGAEASKRKGLAGAAAGRRRFASILDVYAVHFRTSRKCSIIWHCQVHMIFAAQMC